MAGEAALSLRASTWPQWSGWSARISTKPVLRSWGCPLSENACLPTWHLIVLISPLRQGCSMFLHCGIISYCPKQRKKGCKKFVYALNLNPIYKWRFCGVEYLIAILIIAFTSKLKGSKNTETKINVYDKTINWNWRSFIYSIKENIISLFYFIWNCKQKCKKWDFWG